MLTPDLPSPLLVELRPPVDEEWFSRLQHLEKTGQETFEALLPSEEVRAVERVNE